MGGGAWEEWIGATVVVDTDSVFVYLGTLAEVRKEFVILKDADAHDRNDGHANKEHYVMEAKRYGVTPNRKEVAIRRDMIVGLSRLQDVLDY